MIGFETIGNATLTAFDDGKSILSIDPWVDGNPYFGSWGYKYRIQKNKSITLRMHNISGYPMVILKYTKGF